MNTLRQFAHSYTDHFRLNEVAETSLVEGLAVLDKRTTYVIQQCTESMEFEIIGFTHDLEEAKATCHHTHDKIFTVVDHISHYTSKDA